MAKLYMLIGVPGSGKSTWINNQDWSKDCALISTDKLIEIEATRLGKTYNDVFKDYIKQATQIMTQEVEAAVLAGQDIIWDQTNTGRDARKSKLAQVPNYYKIAVVFATPESEEWQRRLNNRPGKSIPPAVLSAMARGLQLPTEDEFNEIWRAQ
jgi:predicted kinase